MTETYTPAGAAPKRSPRKVSIGTPIVGEKPPQAALPPKPVAATAPMPAIEAPGDDPVAKRIEEIRERRKERRSVDVSGLNQKLSVPDTLKDPRFQYRWVKDTQTRLYEMQQKDYEFVDDKRIAQDERNSGVGSRIERISDERTTTKPQKTFLMRKPREFYEEDKGKEQARIKAHEQAIQRGEVRNAEGQSEPGMYVPAGGMKIDHGQK